MIEWLASKVAMTLAAFVLLASAVGLFGALQEDAARRTLAATADRLGRFLDGVGRTPGILTIRVAFDGTGAFNLPPEVNGAAYTIEFRSTHVVLAQGSRIAFRPVIRPLHLWTPTQTAYTGEEIAALDAAVGPLVVPSGTAFRVTRISLIVDGEAVMRTFVALPPSQG